MRLKTTAVITTAILATVRALPGQVCFWPERGEQGTEGAWCYDSRRGGFAEPAAHVFHHARSFSSQADEVVYALHFPPSGPCLQRTITALEYSENWDWWDKLDGVDSTPHEDCTSA